MGKAIAKRGASRMRARGLRPIGFWVLSANLPKIDAAAKKMGTSRSCFLSVAVWKMVDELFPKKRKAKP